jgi:hypothetical protein
MLEDLEPHSEELQPLNFYISLTTLEEVFLMLVSMFFSFSCDNAAFFSFTDSAVTTDYQSARIDVGNNSDLPAFHSIIVPVFTDEDSDLSTSV